GPITAAFTLPLLRCGTCSTGNGSCQAAPPGIQQVVTQTVNPDPLGITLMEPTVPGGLPAGVTMNAIMLNGKVQTSHGNINPVTLVGWSLTAQFQSANSACAGTGGAACPGSSPAHNTIPASNMLLVAPVVACADAGNPATVPPTPPSCLIGDVTQAAANHQV